MNDFDQIMANANSNTTKSNKSFDKNASLLSLACKISNVDSFDFLLIWANKAFASSGVIIR